jgi:hypothetical protein
MMKSSTPGDHGAVKKMRNGTRSCIECKLPFFFLFFLAHSATTDPWLASSSTRYLIGRRRKVRCVFSASGTTCFSCAARRSRCVGQGEKRSDVETCVPAPEPVAQASISEKWQYDTNAHPAGNHDDAVKTSNTVLSNEIDHHAPFASVLIDAQVFHHRRNLSGWQP